MIVAYASNKKVVYFFKKHKNEIDNSNVLQTIYLLPTKVIAFQVDIVPRAVFGFQAIKYRHVLSKFVDVSQVVVHLLSADFQREFWISQLFETSVHLAQRIQVCSKVHCEASAVVQSQSCSHVQRLVNVFAVSCI